MTYEEIKAKYMEDFHATEPLLPFQQAHLDQIYRRYVSDQDYIKKMKALGKEFIFDIPPREMFETHEYNDMKPRREEKQEPKVYRDDDKQVWNTLKS